MVGQYKVEGAIGGEGRIWVNHHLGHTEYTGSVNTLYTLYTGTSLRVDHHLGHTEYTHCTHTVHRNQSFTGSVCKILTAGQYIKPV